MGKNRVFSQAYKVAAAKRLVAGESSSKLQRELGVKRSVLYRWADAYRQFGEAALARQPGRPKKVRAALSPSCPEPAELVPGIDPQAAALVSQQAKRIAELERLAGQQAMDLDFLIRAFKRISESRPNDHGATASTPRCGK